MAKKLDEATSSTSEESSGKKKGGVTVVSGGAKDQDVVNREREEAAAPPGGALSRGGVRQTDITTFLRQLIMLLEAGTPILKSIKTLAQRGERQALRALVSDIAQYVESGNPLWQAFDRHPRYFDTVFVNLIKASEASGTLVPVLRRVVEYREEREVLEKRMRNAMLYPALLVIACLGVLLLLTNFVVPEFQEMFEKADLELPAITETFIFWSNIVAVWWWVPILVVAGLIVLYKTWYVRSPLRRLTADRIKLKLPVLGRIILGTAIVEMTRTMSILLRSGLSMMATLDLSRRAIHNRAVAQTLQTMRDYVEEGGGLEKALREHSDVIPPVVADMFVTGEETGRVDAVAEQLADTYEEDVRIAVAGLGEALQPIFTVIIGVIVAGLFVSLFLPLVTMIEKISGAGL